MPLYNKKWWQKLFKKETHNKKVDVLKDIKAMQEFLQEITDDTSILKEQLKKLEELEKESYVADTGILHINLETQAQVYEKLLKHFEFFASDVDINEQRLKLMVQKYLKKASRNGLKDLVWEKQRDPKWKGEW